MNKILVPTGYMGSGSSAVTDILAEIDGCSARDGDFEFVFLHCPNGVFDLEDKLLLGNNAIRSDEALHSFLGTMKQLCTKKYWWVGHYNEHVGPGFYDLCLRFVDELTFSRPNYYWYWQENTNARMFVELCIRKIVWLLTLKKVLLRKPRTYYDTMLSIPTEEEFYSAASRFISGVMDEIGLQEHNIVLDQLLLPHNLSAWIITSGTSCAYSRSAATRAMCSSRTNTSGGRAITPSCSRRMRRNLRSFTAACAAASARPAAPRC